MTPPLPLWAGLCLAGALVLAGCLTPDESTDPGASNSGTGGTSTADCPEDSTMETASDDCPADEGTTTSGPYG